MTNDVWILTKEDSDGRGFENQIVTCFVGKPTETQVIEAIVEPEDLAQPRITCNVDDYLCCTYKGETFECQPYNTQYGQEEE